MMNIRESEKSLHPLESIRLRGMLPEVFRSERIPASEVWNVDITFRRGEKVLVEATSGAGKSSMCSFIYGARRDYIGELLFNNLNAAAFRPELWQWLRRESIACLPQELSLFPELTAMENIHLKNELTGAMSPERIRELLDRLGVASRSDYPVGRMSVGQQQRVALIRSICQPFDFILLDEPVSHLDATNNRIAAAIIREEAERRGAGIISTSVGNHLLLDYDRILHL